MGKAYENVSLYAEHIDDPGAPPDHLKPETVETGAGSLEIGVVIDGVKKPLFRGKAGGFLDDLKRAQDAKQEEANAPADAQQTQSY